MQHKDGQQGKRKDGWRTSRTRRLAAGALFAAAAYCVYRVPADGYAREALRAQLLFGIGTVVALAAGTLVVIFTPAPSEEKERGVAARGKRLRRGPFDLSQRLGDASPAALADRAEGVPQADRARDDFRGAGAKRPPPVAPGLLAELEPLAWSAPPPEPRRNRLAPSPVVLEGGDEASREALARLLRRGGYYVRIAEGDAGTSLDDASPPVLRLALEAPAGELAEVPA